MTCRTPPDPHRPVPDEAALAARASELLPVAIRRQLWTLFFDADDVQLPMMVPFEGISEWPSPRAVDDWGVALEAVVAEFHVAWLAFVVERPGASTASESDLAWRDALLALGATGGLVVRSVLGCSDDGVTSWSAQGAGTSDQSDERARVISRAVARQTRGQSSPRRLALAEVLPLR
ncbi:hypothetical protein SOM11_03655 [Frigoribacterium sp. CFBP9039]|uniref:hypothetical protein n=1 Tax=Frigoribacterium sp. CFBP9029 TaxID=3096541 RepID=UPI002A6ABC63|nr:hypothetical protein [Frigoribacterium sp. CFBP9039]MDY0945074.1 hypothetical protein [Frigoribacterium sp. CFBP9039]